MKKRFVIILIIPLFILVFSTIYVYAKAETVNDETSGDGINADEIESIADKIYDGLNTAEIEKYLADLIPPFASCGSLKDFIKNMINGESENYETLFDYLLSLVTSGFREQLPAFVSLFVLIVFSSLLKLFAPSDKSGAGELAGYAIFTAIICIVAGVVYGTIAKAESTLDKLSGFIEAVYPIVMTLTVACGATNSSLTVTPAALFVSDTVIVLIKNVFFPIIYVCRVYCFKYKQIDKIKEYIWIFICFYEMGNRTFHRCLFAFSRTERVELGLSGRAWIQDRKIRSWYDFTACRQYCR